MGGGFQFFDVETANRTVEYAVGVNWWMNAFLRLQVNGIWERFKTPLPSGETSAQ